MKIHSCRYLGIEVECTCRCTQCWTGILRPATPTWGFKSNHVKKYNRNVTTISWSIFTCSCDRWDNVLDSWVRWWRCCPPPEKKQLNLEISVPLTIFHFFLAKDTNRFCHVLDLPPQTSKFQDKRPAPLVPYQTRSHCALGPPVAEKEIYAMKILSDLR